MYWELLEKWIYRDLLEKWIIVSYWTMDLLGFCGIIQLLGFTRKKG